MTVTATRLRDLECEGCGTHWPEPVRRGAKPRRCPTCDPDAATRREIERRRAQGKPKPAAPAPVIAGGAVPAHLVSGVMASVRVSTAFEEPGREDLAREVRTLAAAVGPDETRASLRRLAGLCLAWDSWLDETATKELTMNKAPHAHGLYTREGKRIPWVGKVTLNPNTNEPQLEPPIRLGRGEVVYLWWEDSLVAEFGDGGQTHKPDLEVITFD